MCATNRPNLDARMEDEWSVDWVGTTSWLKAGSRVHLSIVCMYVYIHMW